MPFKLTAARSAGCPILPATIVHAAFVDGFGRCFVGDYAAVYQLFGVGCAMTAMNCFWSVLFLGLSAMLGVSYAMAENTFAVTQTLPGKAVKLDTVDRFALETDLVAFALPQRRSTSNSKKVSCGSPIARTAVCSTKQPNLTRAACVGELAVQSNCMLTEYYRRCDLDPFHAGWYLTGDMGYVVDGEVYAIGHSKI